ncbi:hypothetical protein Trydic_g8072 [Trypoxylus dichotomus]
MQTMCLDTNVGKDIGHFVAPNMWPGILKRVWDGLAQVFVKIQKRKANSHHKETDGNYVLEPQRLAAS